MQKSKIKMQNDRSEVKIVSACLLGVRCCWDGSSRKNQQITKLKKNKDLIPVCPEQLGGLTTPRLPSEIQGGSGVAVITGKAKVFNREGKDVTMRYIRGAKESLKIAKLLGAQEFIGKQKSPSCGCGKSYDGTFSGKIIEGDGVTTALLKENDIKVITEEDL